MRIYKSQPKGSEYGEYGCKELRMLAFLWISFPSLTIMNKSKSFEFVLANFIAFLWHFHKAYMHNYNMLNHKSLWISCQIYSFLFILYLFLCKQSLGTLKPWKVFSDLWLLKHKSDFSTDFGKKGRLWREILLLKTNMLKWCF